MDPPSPVLHPPAGGVDLWGTGYSLRDLQEEEGEGEGDLTGLPLTAGLPLASRGGGGGGGGDGGGGPRRQQSMFDGRIEVGWGAGWGLAATPWCAFFLRPVVGACPGPAIRACQGLPRALPFRPSDPPDRSPFHPPTTPCCSWWRCSGASILGSCRCAALLPHFAFFPSGCFFRLGC